MAESKDAPKSFILLIPSTAVEDTKKIVSAQSEEDVQTISDELFLWTDAPGWGPEDNHDGAKLNIAHGDKSSSTSQ